VVLVDKGRGGGGSMKKCPLTMRREFIHTRDDSEFAGYYSLEGEDCLSEDCMWYWKCREPEEPKPYFNMENIPVIKSINYEEIVDEVSAESSAENIIGTVSPLASIDRDVGDYESCTQGGGPCDCGLTHTGECYGYWTHDMYPQFIYDCQESLT